MIYDDRNTGRDTAIGTSTSEGKDDIDYGTDFCPYYSRGKL